LNLDPAIETAPASFARWLHKSESNFLTETADLLSYKPPPSILR